MCSRSTSARSQGVPNVGTPSYSVPVQRQPVPKVFPMRSHAQGVPKVFPRPSPGVPVIPFPRCSKGLSVPKRPVIPVHRCLFHPPMASSSSSPSLCPLQLPVSSVYLQLPAMLHHGSVYRTELPTSVGRRSTVPVCRISWWPGLVACRTKSACVTYMWIRAWGSLYAAPTCITLASNHTASPRPRNNFTIVAPSFESIQSWPTDCRDTRTVPGAVP